MSWTYTQNPGSIPRDRIRFLIGDTTQSPTSLSDDELAYLLTESGNNTEMAAANAADLWAGKFAGLSASSKSVGDLQIAQDHAGACARLSATASRLRARYGGIGVALMFDTSPNVFAVGMDDNPGTGSTDSTVRYF